MHKTSNLQTRYGPWALVTGASSGIGEEFAEQLASLGFNIVLVARSKNKLDAVSERVRQHGVETLVIVADLSTPDFIHDLSEKTKELEIGLLVSNAGGYTYGS